MVADMVTERPWTSVETSAASPAACRAATSPSSSANRGRPRPGGGRDRALDGPLHCGPSAPGSAWATPQWTCLDSSRRRGRPLRRNADDLAALESVAALHPDAATFEAWLRGVLGRQPPGDDVVLLSTVHRIKGKEWDHVVVFGASAGLFPHRLSDDERG